MITIRFMRTSPDDINYKLLTGLLDQDLAIRDGDDHAFYAPFNTSEKIKHAIIGYDDEKPVCCGALRAYDAETVEIKRMFVQAAYRSKGIGLLLLQELENQARELHFPCCILETGKKQVEAIRLYQKAGYHVIKNYGPYELVENSVCMSKIL